MTDMASLRRSAHEVLLQATDTAMSIERSAVVNAVASVAPLLSHPDFDHLVEDVLADVHGLGSLEALMVDPQVTDVMLVGGRGAWVERNGKVVGAPAAVDATEVTRLIERIVAPLGLRVDRSSPMVDARLPDGSRVNVVVPPLAIDGPCLTIRRFGARHIPLHEIGGNVSTRLLTEAVQGRMNILVSGGTGAGKTTLLNALASHLDAGERVITVEDAAELSLPVRHVVRLESRPANAEGVGRVTLRDLVRNALRMRPDRIIVGEVRGGEALDMLQAMNTGHEGSMSTCHANSPDDALRRIETMVLMAETALPLAAVRQQMAASIDLIVQIERGSTARRHISQVCEVTSANDDDRTRTLVRNDELVAMPTRSARRAMEH